MPYCPPVARRVSGALALAASGAAVGGAQGVAAGLGLVALTAAWKMFRQCGATMLAIHRAATACGLIENGPGAEAVGSPAEVACALEPKDGQV